MKRLGLGLGAGEDVQASPVAGNWAERTCSSRCFIRSRSYSAGRAEGRVAGLDGPLDKAFEFPGNAAELGVGYCRSGRRALIGEELVVHPWPAPPGRFRSADGIVLGGEDAATGGQLVSATGQFELVALDALGAVV